MDDIAPPTNKVIRLIHKFEDWVLVTATVAIVVFSAIQIFLRNIFESGVVWISPMLGMLVLWVGLLGALLATRQHAHIKINVLSNYLPENYKPVAIIVSNLFSAIILFVLAYYSVEFVKLDWNTDATAFANVPVWAVQAIMPVSFLFMGIRFLLYTATGIIQLIERFR